VSCCTGDDVQDSGRAASASAAHDVTGVRRGSSAGASLAAPVIGVAA
jgi:hypothetical protein